MSAELDERLREVRDLFNEAPFYNDLMRDVVQYQQACSSMDMLADTRLAVEAFGKLELPPNDSGALYLVIFGVLQAMQTQQDALQGLEHALSYYVDKKPTRELAAAFRDVGRLRSRAVGHPTNPTKSGTDNCFGIIRGSMTRTNFDLYTFDYRTWLPERVDLTGLIAAHLDEMTKQVTSLRDALLRVVR
ncbi:MAG: hypothetical protein ACKVWV_12085 [Planctomycetota bacterium]